MILAIRFGDYGLRIIVRYHFSRIVCMNEMSAPFSLHPCRKGIKFVFKEVSKRKTNGSESQTLQLQTCHVFGHTDSFMLPIINAIRKYTVLF